MIIKEFDQADQLYYTLARDILAVLPSSGKSKLSFALVLSGGRSPVQLHRHLVEQTLEFKSNWNNVLFFFSDERCVSPDDQLSNYGLARNTLFVPLGLADTNIYRIKGELAPEEAAAEYHKALDDFFKHKTYLDLSLLGMGSDGHTASLFPHTNALSNQNRFAAYAGTGPEGSERVSLTYNALNACRQIWVMVTGKDKKRVLDKALETESSFRDYPIKAIKPQQELVFYCSP